MSTFTYIYNIQGEVKLLDTLNYTLEEFKTNPQACYPNWDNQTMYATDTKFEYPIMDKDSIREMTLMERYNKGLYELGEHEVIYNNNILKLEAGQYIDEKGVLQTVPKLEGVRVEWNWQTHEWEEKATNLEIVQAQYRDYEGMDTPSTLEEMKQQDPAMVTEYINMMIELRNLIYTLSASEQQPVGYTVLPIPQPSKALKDFKNKFNLTR